MRFKRLLALLLAAALALAVLVGCGSGQQSAAQALLKLLDGKYPNISIEIDPDLEADLRQAVSEGETDAEIRAALEKLLGSGVSFRLIGDGQKGDSAWNLILYPGSDPDAAARSAYLEWDKIFSAFPSSGLYTAKLSMIETDNGYAILVQATVDKAARRNDDDDDEPEEPEDPGYTVDDDGNYTVNTDDGLQNLFADNLTSDFAGKTITLDKNLAYIVDTTNRPLAETFKGELHGNGATVTITGGIQGLFNEIDTDGKVLNVDIEVNGTISVSKVDDSVANVGAVAGTNYGKISGCDVTISNGGKIDGGVYSAGGVVGWNYKTISDCTVTITGTISGTGLVGGVAGYNEDSEAIIKNCRVESGTIQGSSSGTGTAGGIVGDNRGTIQGCSSAAAVQYGSNTGGVVGNNHGEITACYSTGTVTGATGEGTKGAGGVVGYNVGGGTVTACYSTGNVQGNSSNTGGVVGQNGDEYSTGTINDCYWRGYDGNGIGKDNTGNYNGGNGNKEEHEKYYLNHNNKVTTVEVWNKLVAAMASNGYTLSGTMDNPTLTQN